LRSRLCIYSVVDVIRRGRFSWIGLVRRADLRECIGMCESLTVEGVVSVGRSSKYWMVCV
jgi:hypothetical protein